MSTETPLPEPTPAPPPAPRKPRRRFLWPLVALLALGLTGWQWYDSQARLQALEQKLNEQLASADKASQARLSAIDSRLDEALASAQKIDALLDEIDQGKTEVALLEVEQAITLASQQLQLAGNTRVALRALQVADAQLARLDAPEHLALRKSLARDIDRLAALPQADIAGASLRLEQVLANIDTLPLKSSSRPTTAASPVSPAAPATAGWQGALATAWQEIKGLVRIQRFDADAAELLVPGQEFFLRENLKLRLLNGRLALFARDSSSFRQEMKTAAGWLERYFVVDAPGVAKALADLKQLATLDPSGIPGDLAETRQALTKLLQGRERQ